VTLHNVLTGFKFIGEVIKQQEAKGEGSFVFGFEESYGYLKGSYARDKDAVVTSMLICEMTAYYAAKGMTLADALDALYERYGYSFEANQELYMEGLDGIEKMKALMDSLRKAPPAYVGGQPMAVIADYLTGQITDCTTGAVTPTGLTTSNVLRFVLRNGDVIAIRPSGTEPKIKLYYLLRGKNRAACEANLASYQALMNSRTKM
jgi:phosphoglucomutase